jgi:PAS domain S-box-containing protein
MRRRTALVLFTFAVALSAGALALALSSDHVERPGPSGALFVAVPLGFVGAGVVAAMRRPGNRTGLLMIATGFTWFLGSLTASNNAFVFTLGVALGAIAYAFVVILALGYPTAELRGRLDRSLAAIAALLATAGQVGFLLVLDSETLCGTGLSCPENLLQLTSDDTARAVVSWGLNVVVAVTLAAIVGRMAKRWRRASPALRRALGPVYVTAVAAFVAIVLAVIANDVSDELADAMWVVQIATLLAVPLAFLLGLLRSRLARASVGSLVVAVGRGVPLRTALADALGDPGLEIGYWVDERQVFVDDEGRGFEPASVSGTRASTVIERDGQRIAVLVHDASLLQEPELIDGVTGAAALALEAERLKAEFRAQFAFLDTVINTAPSLLVNVGPDGRILDQNRAAVRAFGYDDGERVRGRPFWEVFIDPDEQEAVRARFAAAAPGHPPAQYVNAFTNARGERLVIEWRSAPVLDASGRAISIVAGGLDITERRRLDEQIRRERDLLFTMSRATPSLLVVLDTDGRVNQEFGVSKAVWDVLGYTDELAKGRPVWDLVPAAEEADEFRAAITDAIATGSLVARETTWVSLAGERYSVAWSCRPLGEVDGRRLYLVCGTDVTERRQRENQLQRERDITSTLMEAIPSVVVVVDEEATIVDSGVDETRAGVNEAFRQALEWPDDKIVRRSVLDLIDPAQGFEALMAIASAANGVKSGERESRWLRANGSHVVMAWTATPVADVTGRRASLVLISGIDVTDRKRHEEEIRASRTRIIEAADAARRVLERNLHDGAQQRLVSLALSLRLAEARTLTHPEHAAAILAEARAELASALDELRELARGIHPAVLTDRGLTAAIEALVARTPFPVEVETPASRLRPAVEAAAYYVIAEALTNVAKYAQASSARVSVREADGEMVLVEVVDDGVGGADPDSGSGLRGLQDRVAALDGRLEVTSVAGEGTCVRAEIPL